MLLCRNRSDLKLSNQFVMTHEDVVYDFTEKRLSVIKHDLDIFLLF